MNLIRTSFIITFFSITVTLISFLNQVVIASFFGTSRELDLFFIGISFPVMVGAVITLSFSYYLIPHFVNLNNSQTNLEKFKSYLVRFMFSTNYKINLFLIPLATVFYILIPVIYSIDEIIEIKLVRLINLVSWITVIISINYSILTAYLNSKKQFLLPVILNSLPFIFSILIVFFLGKKIGIISIVLGTFFGSIFILMYLIFKEKNNFSLSKIESKMKKKISIFHNELIFAVFAMLSFTMFQTVEAFWVPKIGESAMSYVGFSQRLIIAIGSLVITGPSIVLIPTLTEKFKKIDKTEYFHNSSLTIRLVILLSSIACLLIYPYSLDIISILFERGEFNNESTIGVSKVFSSFLIGMIFMLISVVVFRILFTQKIDYKISLIGISSVLIYFTCLAVFTDMYQIDGVGYAYFVTWLIISKITIIKLFRTRLIYFFNKDLILLIFKIVALFFIIKFLRNSFFIELDFNFFNNKLNLIMKTSLNILKDVIFIVLFSNVLKIKEYIFIINKLFNKR